MTETLAFPHRPVARYERVTLVTHAAVGGHSSTSRTEEATDCISTVVRRPGAGVSVRSGQGIVGERDARRASRAGIVIRRLSLPDSWRRTPKFVLSGVLLLLLMGLGIAVYGEHLNRESSRRAAEVQAAMLAGSVGVALEYEDVSIVRENVRALSANPAIAVAAIYDEAGRRVAGFARDGRVLPERLPAATSPLSLAMPVANGGERVGTVYVRAALEPLPARLARYGGFLLLAAMGGIAVLVVLIAAAAQRRTNAELAATNEALLAQIVEREQAEERLRQAQKMQAVGQLTGGIAHDFNNLLTPIMGGLEIIATATAEPRVRGLANNALEAARRGAKLTGQLLAFSRTHRLATSSVPVNDVILGLKDMLRHSIGASVDVRLALDSGCGTASCDANQIENAILNLAINARDAMPDGGTLTIRTGRVRVAHNGELSPGDYVAISVVDTGTGMTPEVLARATEPFFTTKPVGKGTGLGLAQVYGIAHQFSGTVKIESEVGVGTAIHILLPSAGAADRPADASEDGIRVAAHPGAEILIVDDDADVRNFLAGTLESLGYRVKAAESGDEGLRLLAQHEPDMMLVDYAMPGLNGADVARAARDRCPRLPIVFVTGYADTEALKDAIGPDAPMLHKPFGARELASAVDRQLAQRAA